MFRAPTPPDRLVDPQGRPYWLWDVAMTLSEWQRKVASEDPEEAGYWLARALRDAKPDDVLEFVTMDEIAARWPAVERHLGRRRAFWRWWLGIAGHAVA